MKKIEGCEEVGSSRAEFCQNPVAARMILFISEMIQVGTFWELDWTDWHWLERCQDAWEGCHAESAKKSSQYLAQLN